MTTTSRRQFLQTAAAAAPISAFPLAATAASAIPAMVDADVMAAGQVVEETWLRIGTTHEKKDHADDAVFEWKHQNPEPVKPESRFRKPTKTERDNWARIIAEADNPRREAIRLMFGEDSRENPGLKEYEEYEEAHKLWQLRYEAATRESGQDEIEAVQNAICDENFSAIETLANTRARTIEGLRCKARLFRMMGDEDDQLALSLVDDLLEWEA